MGARAQIFSFFFFFFVARLKPAACVPKGEGVPCRRFKIKCVHCLNQLMGYTLPAPMGGKSGCVRKYVAPFRTKTGQ